MANKNILRLQWKLFFPLVGLLWLIIGITITYFVRHEKQRQRENLENRLLNVNNTVIEAYGLGADIQKTVDFIQLFTDHTTLDPLLITVYDSNGMMIADNPATALSLHDDSGNSIPELAELLTDNKGHAVRDITLGDEKMMVSQKRVPTGAYELLRHCPTRARSSTS